MSLTEIRNMDIAYPGRLDAYWQDLATRTTGCAVDETVPGDKT